MRMAMAGVPPSMVLLLLACDTHTHTHSHSHTNTLNKGARAIIANRCMGTAPTTAPFQNGYSAGVVNTTVIEMCLPLAVTAVRHRSAPHGLAAPGLACAWLRVRRISSRIGGLLTCCFHGTRCSTQIVRDYSRSYRVKTNSGEALAY